MTILDGKKVSNEIKDEIAVEVQQMKDRGEKVPHLAAIIVGNDGASLTYVNAKVKACEKVGFESTLVHMDTATSEEDLLNKIAELNNDDSIDGFIVQLPLPEHLAPFASAGQAAGVVQSSPSHPVWQKHWPLAQTP